MRQLSFESHDENASVIYLNDEQGTRFALPVSEELAGVFNNDSQSHSNGHDDEEAGLSVTVIESTEPYANDAASGEKTDKPTLEPVDDAADSSASEHRASEVPATSSVMPGRARTLPEPDPLYTSPMSMRPSEIQQRIRGGATAAELASEMGVAESRVEPFAHPVMLERERIAELAKQAHPVREDGPAKLTLWEILATSFAARGHSLADSTWDAYRTVAREPWIIEVSWTAGLSQNSATWLFRNHPTSPDTVEARNSVAADLTDPDFINPVRSVTSLHRETDSLQSDEPYNQDAEFDGVISGDDIAGDELAAHKKRKYGKSHPLTTADTTNNAVDNSGTTDDDDVDTRDDLPVVETDDDGQPESGEDFLQNPDPQQPKKRRRKAVTPHWEDVLLGVRANTKRPRR